MPRLTPKSKFNKVLKNLTSLGYQVTKTRVPCKPNKVGVVLVSKATSLSFTNAQVFDLSVYSPETSQIFRPSSSQGSELCSSGCKFSPKKHWTLCRGVVRELNKAGLPFYWNRYLYNVIQVIVVK